MINMLMHIFIHSELLLQPFEPSILLTSEENRLGFPVPTHPSTPCTGHCGPEESSPVLVLEDVGKDAGQDASAVQDYLLFFLRGTARLCSLDQLLHSLKFQEAL